MVFISSKYCRQINNVGLYITPLLNDFTCSGFISNLLRTGDGFACTECGKEFKDPSNARRHVKNSHNHVTGVLSCDFCQRLYKNNDSLRDHQRKAHGIYKQ